MDVPKYVSKLKHFKIFDYETIMKENPRDRKSAAEELDVSEEQLRSVEEAIKDKAVKLENEGGKIPSGYPYYQVAKIDGVPLAIFMKHNIKFDLSY